MFYAANTLTGCYMYARVCFVAMTRASYYIYMSFKCCSSTRRATKLSLRTRRTHISVRCEYYEHVCFSVAGFFGPVKLDFQVFFFWVCVLGFRVLFPRRLKFSCVTRATLFDS